jgi:hypothetical protein
MNEHRRRHGLDKRLDAGGNTVTELAKEAKVQMFGKKDGQSQESNTAVGSGRSREEEKLRALKESRPTRKD